MTKITLGILITTFLLVAGCATNESPRRATELEPLPQNPKYTVSITIDSIPSGADVYAVEEDGQLGEKIGTTPFMHECGIAWQNYVYSDTKEHAGRYYREVAFGSGTHIFGSGTHIIDRYGDLVLNIALVKGDHSIAVASKVLLPINSTYKDAKIALTVPLKTLAQVNRELELYLRQQELANARNSSVQGPSQNQNITVTQKKDGRKLGTVTYLR